MATNKIIYNGEILDSMAGIIDAGNRAFLYGDGLFETIKIINGRPCFLESHINRLKQGLAALKIRLPEGFDFNVIQNEIQSLLEINGITLGGRCRLTVSRKSQGFYTPVDAAGIDYLIQVQSQDINEFVVNKERLNIDIYTDRVKQITSTSNFKTLNCELYVLAGIFSKEIGKDDVLVRNDSDAIIESTNSNLFITSNGVIYTVPLADGCVGGVMRMNIINLAIANGLRVYETTFTPRNLLVADEVFLTNATSGIRWVQSYKQKRYSKALSPQLLNLLNKSY